MHDLEVNADMTGGGGELTRKGGVEESNEENSSKQKKKIIYIYIFKCEFFFPNVNYDIKNIKYMISYIFWT